MPPLGVDWVGVMLTLSVVLGYQLFRFQAERDGWATVGPFRLVALSAITWGIGGALVGSLALNITTLSQPAALFGALRPSNYCLYTGMLAGAIALRRSAATVGLPPSRVLDAAVLPVVQGIVAVRSAQYLLGQRPGLPADILAGRQHPVALYDAVTAVVALALARVLYRKFPAWTLAAAFMLAYAGLRCLFVEPCTMGPVVAPVFANAHLGVRGVTVSHVATFEVVVISAVCVMTRGCRWQLSRVSLGGSQAKGSKAGRSLS